MPHIARWVKPDVVVPAAGCHIDEHPEQWPAQASSEPAIPDRPEVDPESTSIDTSHCVTGKAGENAHRAADMIGCQLIGEHWPKCADQVALLVDVDRRSARPAACRTRCCRRDAGCVRVRSSVCAFAAAMSAAGGSQRVAEGCAPVQDLTAGPPAQDRSCPQQQLQVI